MANASTDILIGMKAICQHLHGKSEVTILKWHRESGLPMKKSSKNGTAGCWIASRKRLDNWFEEFTTG